MIIMYTLNIYNIFYDTLSAGLQVHMMFTDVHNTHTLLLIANESNVTAITQWYCHYTRAEIEEVDGKIHTLRGIITSKLSQCYLPRSCS